MRPYRAEMVRRLVAGVTPRSGYLSPIQLTRVWPRLCEALGNLEEEGAQFALAALRELAQRLPPKERAQAYGLLGGNSAPPSVGQ